jgi:hypothetical protein
MRFPANVGYGNQSNLISCKRKQQGAANKPRSLQRERTQIKSDVSCNGSESAMRIGVLRVPNQSEGFQSQRWPRQHIATTDGWHHAYSVGTVCHLTVTRDDGATVANRFLGFLIGYRERLP